MVLESLNSETPNIKDLSVEDLSHQEEVDDLIMLFDLKKVREQSEVFFKLGRYEPAVQILANFKIFSGPRFNDILPTLNCNQIYFTIFSHLKRTFAVGNNLNKPLVSMIILFPELFNRMCRDYNEFAELSGASYTELESELKVFEAGDVRWLTAAYRFNILFPDQQGAYEKADFSNFQNELTRQINNAFDEETGNDSLKKDVCIFAKELRIVYGNDTFNQVDFQKLYQWFQGKVQREKDIEDSCDDLAKIGASLAIINAENVTVDNEGIKISGNKFLLKKLETENALPPLPETRNF